MQAVLKRIDDRIANAEAKIATVVLLLMIAAAALQSSLQILAKKLQIDAAQSAIESLGNIDHFLQTATLWLAFLGASLATHADKHIAIDVLDRILPETARRFVKAFTYIFSGVISLLLTWVFIEVILKDGSTLPSEFAMFGDAGEIHVCDAPEQLLSDNEISRPGLFCGVRSMFAGVGVTLQAPRPAFQLVVPILFSVIAFRFLLRGLGFLLGAEQSKGEKPHTEVAS